MILVSLAPFDLYQSWYLTQPGADAPRPLVDSRAQESGGKQQSLWHLCVSRSSPVNTSKQLQNISKQLGILSFSVPGFLHGTLNVSPWRWHDPWVTKAVSKPSCLQHLAINHLTQHQQHKASHLQIAPLPRGRVEKATVLVDPWEAWSIGCKTLVHLNPFSTSGWPS